MNIDSFDHFNMSEDVTYCAITGQVFLDGRTHEKIKLVKENVLVYAGLKCNVG
jgi:hypothetical protein